MSFQHRLGPVYGEVVCKCFDSLCADVRLATGIIHGRSFQGGSKRSRPLVSVGLGAVHVLVTVGASRVLIGTASRG